MSHGRLGRLALLAGAAALLVVPAAWRAGISSGACGDLEEVVNTGACVDPAAPGLNIARHKSGKLLDHSRCTTYPGRAADEDSFHKNRSTSDAPFNTTNDFDSGDISVVFDDGTVVFDTVNGTEIDFIRAVKKFYLNPAHPDAYHFLFIWPNFNHAEGSFHVNVKNGIRGLHQAIHDDFAIYGTRKLESFVNFRNYVNFPSDVNARIPTNNDTTLTLIAQETGHRWGAYVFFDCDPSSRVKNCSNLLGRGLGHWCYFANVPAVVDARNSSILEGNAWADNGNGTFTTTNNLGTGGYSQLDQYLMGFRLPTDVAATFTIKPPQNSARTCSDRPYTPEIDGPTPITVGGTRLNASINDIIRIEGLRNPDATMAPRKFRMAFMLLARQGTTVAQSDLDKLNGIRLAWETFFSQQSQGLGQAVTALGPVDMDEDGYNTISDCDDGDPLINPAAAEACNRFDDNCDGVVDEGFDADGDLWTTCNGDCNDANASINPNATEILGNGIDENCDGIADNETPVDADLDGYSPPMDCNENNSTVNPGAVEKVNLVDDNCNGFVDCDDPTVVTETEKGSRAHDGLDNDCNEIVDG